MPSALAQQGDAQPGLYGTIPDLLLVQLRSARIHLRNAGLPPRRRRHTDCSTPNSAAQGFLFNYTNAALSELGVPAAAIPAGRIAAAVTAVCSRMIGLGAPAPRAGASPAVAAAAQQLLATRGGGAPATPVDARLEWKHSCL
jgi:hypothetical protein